MSAESPLTYILLAVLIAVLGFAISRIRLESRRRNHYRRKTRP